MKQKAEIFHGIKNKEETDWKHLVGCVYTDNPVRVQQSIYRNTQVMNFSLLMWHWAGATPS